VNFINIAIILSVWMICWFENHRSLYRIMFQLIFFIRTVRETFSLSQFISHIKFFCPSPFYFINRCFITDIAEILVVTISLYRRQVSTSLIFISWTFWIKIAIECFYILLRIVTG